MTSSRIQISATIGIDEVGRGPLAGPVCVGAVYIKKEHERNIAMIFPVIKDSKKLSPKARDEWFARIARAEDDGLILTSVAFVSPQMIDKNGIAPSIRSALARVLKNLVSLNSKNPKTLPWNSTLVLLDGGLRAPVQYEHQQTIIKGDEKELAIALASIVAKVSRDRLMVRLDRKYPTYGFARHKGYGTKAHIAAIKKSGLSEVHRKSFCRGAMEN